MSTKTKLALVFSLLSFMCLVLIVAIEITGVRISSVRLFESNQHQYVVITLNSNISSVDEPIEINPSVSNSVSVSSQQITISFDEPLRYNTNYSIDFSVTDKSGNKSNLTAYFKTEDPNIFYIRRDSDKKDEVRKTKIFANQDDVVFSSDTILDFAAGKSSLLVLTDSNLGRELYLVKGNRSETVKYEGNIIGIDGNDKNNNYVVTFENNKYLKSYRIYNSDKNNWFQIEINNQNNSYGSEAFYTPDGRTISYLDSNQNLIIDDPFDTSSSKNLGVFTEVSRFLTDLSGVFGTRNGKFVILPSNGSAEIISPQEVQTSYLPEVLNNKRDYVFIEQEYKSLQNTIIQNIIYFKERSYQKIGEYSRQDILISELNLSPNDQYIITEQATQPVISDKSVINSNLSGVQSIIRSTDGNVVKTVEGFDLQWR